MLVIIGLQRYGAFGVNDVKYPGGTIVSNNQKH